MRVLVTGGAGYIGSHIVVELVDHGHEPVIVDNFCNSTQTVVSRIAQITGKLPTVWQLDLRDAAGLERLFCEDGPFDAVMHLAALKAVGESVQRPSAYYDNNVGGTLGLLHAMQRHGARTLVFSSSAMVYGPDPRSPLTEDLPVSAANPYGWTKIFTERMLRDMAAADDTWRIALLRYFNPVGAHPSGLIGEDPAGTPNNLMPILARVAVGRLERLHIFGQDYDTPDGTGVRDYIHVTDLAAGHLAAMDYLRNSHRPVNTWNLGTGAGTSVLELLHAFEGTCGRRLPYSVVDRRPGDIAISYADPSRAKAELGWAATKTLDDMCVDAWRWQSHNPSGYPDNREGWRQRPPSSNVTG